MIYDEFPQIKLKEHSNIHFNQVYMRLTIFLILKFTSLYADSPD